MGKFGLVEYINELKCKFKNSDYSDKLSQLNPSLFRTQRMTDEFSSEIQLQYDKPHAAIPQHIFEKPAIIVDEKWGGANPNFYGNTESIDIESLANDYNVFQGCPEVFEFENVIYFPQYPCLYTMDGYRIPVSCCYRKKGRTRNATKAPYEIDVNPKNFPKVEQTLIYAGLIRCNHYGHFLIESISRLWYLYKNVDDPVICHGISTRESPKTSYMDIFFRLIGFDKKRFFHFDEPVLIKKVIVPYPSFSFDAEAFEVHKSVTHNAALQLLPEKEKSIKKTSQPMYFSRRSLSTGFRSIRNEDKLEELLRSKGVAIYYPEKLSLVEQIKLINKHEIIMGTKGSALHNMLFSLFPGKKMICFTFTNHFFLTYLIVDALVKVNSDYICCLFPDGEDKFSAKENQTLDIDVAIDSLKEIGFL
ncbi:MAG: DUF563 domain-containing protein [Crocosphaera sp.]